LYLRREGHGPWPHDCQEDDAEDGGDIEIESTLGTGTTVELSLKRGAAL